MKDIQNPKETFEFQAQRVTMGVASILMESSYGLRIGGLSGLGGIVSHHRLHHPHLHHHRVCSPPLTDSHVVSRQVHHEEQRETESPLRFSVMNILRPEFGREAILNTKSSSKSKVVKPVAHTPLSLPRDLSLSTSRLSPQSPPSTNYGQREGDSFSSHCGLTSPLQRHSGLSRSGSLESLSSNRSSVTGSSVTGAPSLCSTSSSAISGEPLSGESITGSTPSTGVSSQNGTNGQSLWPAWIYCTRYSDRPSSGPRTRRVKRSPNCDKNSSSEEKRPRTAFSGEQLTRLKREFTENRYLTERRRQQLSRDLGLNEAQIKIWFQNKRAKIKKASGQKNPLALQLMAQGLYNHSTVPVDENDEEIDTSGNQQSS